MAEERPTSREQAILAAFEPFLNPQAPSLGRILLASFEFATVETEYKTIRRRGDLGLPNSIDYESQQIVIDKAALFTGIVADGVQRSSAILSSSAWLAQWLNSEGLAPEGTPHLPDRSAEAAASAFASGAGVVASRTLIGRVLPAARDLAQATVGRDRADLRHVLFALLDEPPDSLGPIGKSLTSERLPRLRAWLVDRITASPESEEKVEAWRKLLEPPPPVESVRTLSDAPALIDSLGRQAFAEVLGARIKEVGASLRRAGRNSDSTFILHMDGPWGSGKSSILNFLKADLEASEPSWLVVEFNAWRNQSRKPPWWPLISQVGEAVRALKWYRAPKARLLWAWWRFRMRWAPFLLTALLIAAFVYFAWTAVIGTEVGSRGLPKALQEAVSGLLALVALGGLAWTTSRTLSFGSSNAAEAFVQSSAEPFRRIVGLFERLVRAAKQPVAVFIDDLDRCDSAYVIDLIEGVQTLLRSAPVVYVVAGDRNWICSSFEKRYADFSGQIGTPGRPLGFLFLDKVFQLSTSVPQLSAQRQSEYWRHLLDRSDARSVESEAKERRELEAESAREMKGKVRHEDIQHEIEKAEEGSMKRETLRAAAAKQITSPEAIRVAEHRLQPLAGLLEANPRSMKRLVNAYGLNHARAFLEGRDVSVEALARWTIIELRWPLLADYLVRNWPEIAGGILAPSAFPDQIRELLTDAEVRAAIGADGETGQLNLEALKSILD